ncbi:MAG: folate-binding protein YgfZ [Acidiferrobacterales bacterium]
MNDTWQSFISGQGAHSDNEGRIQFKDVSSETSAAAQGNVIADLSHLSLIEASGQDAETFLLGQFTNDLHSVDKQHSQLSAYCTPKGRMLAIFRVYANDNGLLLQMPSAIAVDTVSRLQMYIMRSKVTLEPVDNLVSIGVAGPGVEPALAAITGDVPLKTNDTIQRNAIMVTRLPGDRPRFSIIADIENIQSVWQQLAANLTPVGSAAWSWLEIEAGQPVVLPETAEAFVPQMANLDLVDGINFKKGCYPGQEIVARMQYLGKLKQRMISARLHASEAPGPGDSLFAPGFRDQSVGTIVDAQASPKGGYDLLAVAKLAAIDTDDLRHGAIDGPGLELTRLPYDLPKAT